MSLPKKIPHYRFMISKAAESVIRTGALPVYEMSSTQEEKGLNALKEHKDGKTTAVKDFADFF